MHALRRRREWVWALKRDFPHLAFSLNGQVAGCHAAAHALAAPVPGPQAGSGSGAAGARIEGVMIGRAAYSAPWACLADADVAVWGAPANAATCRREVRRNAGLSLGTHGAPVQTSVRRASAGLDPPLVVVFCWPLLCPAARSRPATVEQREVAMLKSASMLAISTWQYMIPIGAAALCGVRQRGACGRTAGQCRARVPRSPMNLPIAATRKPLC